MIKLLIFPFNGNGLEALNCLGSNFDFIGFVDDTPEKQGNHKMGFSVLTRQAFDDYPDAMVLAVPGSPSSFKERKKIIDSLNIPETRFARVIHPNSDISLYSQIGHNVLIMAGCVLTSNCVVEDHVCILPNSVIHHDSSIGAYTLVGSNVTIAGGTSIGKNAYIGSGSSIINGISVGDHCLVGMGSNVIKSVVQNTTVVGNPARSL